MMHLSPPPLEEYLICIDPGEVRQQQQRGVCWGHPKHPVTRCSSQPPHQQQHPLQSAAATASWRWRCSPGM